MNGNKEALSLMLYFYDNQAKTNLISQRNYSFVPSVANDFQNFIAQGYEFLKVQPEYVGSIDILEEGQTT